MSAIGDIMTGLRTVMRLTEKVEALTRDVRDIGAALNRLDRRLVRVQTIIEITRGDGATLRIAPPADKEGGD